VILNLAPLFAGRGRKLGEAKFPGEELGTVPNLSASLADGRAPHPNPLPAKSGAREQTTGAAKIEVKGLFA